MPKQIVQTNGAPAAIGPYSQAVVVNGFVFVAGQVALVPGNRKMIAGGVPEQTRQALENLKAILEAAGTSMDNVVKTTVFMRNLDQFDAMNKIYAEYFGECQPARSTIQASRLPATADVEIDAVAVMP